MSVPHLQNLAQRQASDIRRLNDSHCQGISTTAVRSIARDPLLVNFVQPAGWNFLNAPVRIQVMSDERCSLIAVTDDDFRWMLGETRAAQSGLQLPPGGVDDPTVLQIVRGITQRLHDTGCQASWMVVCDSEVVGLCSYRRPPQDGVVEIGYGIAKSRRGRGYATLAVARIVQIAEFDATIRLLVAETSVSNPSSMRVLQKNAFVRSGERVDTEDGRLALWHKRVDGRREQGHSQALQ